MEFCAKLASVISTLSFSAIQQPWLLTQRTKAEEELKETSRLLIQTGEMALVEGWEFDVETGEGTWTDSVSKIHDLEPEHKINVELGMSFYHGESKCRIEAAIKSATEEGIPFDLVLALTPAKGGGMGVRIGRGCLSRTGGAGLGAHDAGEAAHRIHRAFSQADLGKETQHYSIGTGKAAEGARHKNALFHADRNEYGSHAGTGFDLFSFGEGGAYMNGLIGYHCDGRGVLHARVDFGNLGAIGIEADDLFCTEGAFAPVAR